MTNNVKNSTMIHSKSCSPSATVSQPFPRSAQEQRKSVTKRCFVRQERFKAVLRKAASPIARDCQSQTHFGHEFAFPQSQLLESQKSFTQYLLNVSVFSLKSIMEIARKFQPNLLLGEDRIKNSSWSELVTNPAPITRTYRRFFANLRFTILRVVAQIPKTHKSDQVSILSKALVK